MSCVTPSRSCFLYRYSEDVRDLRIEAMVRFIDDEHGERALFDGYVFASEGRAEEERRDELQKTFHPVLAERAGDRL